MEKEFGSAGRLGKCIEHLTVVDNEQNALALCESNVLTVVRRAARVRRQAKDLRKGHGRRPIGNEVLCRVQMLVCETEPNVTPCHVKPRDV